jgi:hypothetical protein
MRGAGWGISGTMEGGCRMGMRKDDGGGRLGLVRRLRMVMLTTTMKMMATVA